MKRRLSAVLALAALLTQLLLSARATGAVLTVRAPGRTIKAGESFAVTVELAGNPGFCAAQFTLTYDRNKMTCTSAAASGLLGGVRSAANANAAGGAAIAAASALPVAGDGELARFQFTARADLKNIAFSLANFALTNESSAAIPCTVVGATWTASETP